jgi:hypothetical protein
MCTPAFDEFVDQIKQIYPEGDLSKAYDRIKWYLTNDPMCANGKPLTYDLIMQKFSDHIRQWNTRYGKRDKKYLAREIEEKRKTLHDFMGARMYNMEFVMDGSINLERNGYLFGKFNMNYLDAQLTDFKTTIENGKQKAREQAGIPE